jgi:hypothetical protein
MLFFFFSHDPSIVLDLVQRLASISVIISSLEFLVIRNILTDGGLMSWKPTWVGIKSMGGHLWHFQTKSLGYIFGYPAVLVVICIRLLCAVMLLLGIIQENNLIETILVLLISITSIILVVRAPYGHSGADQMTLILFVTASIAHVFGNVMTQNQALFFIVAQACLAYFTAGVYKARSPFWRSGKAFVSTFASETFGNKTIARFLDANQKVSKILANGLILFECLFPLVLLPTLLPLPYLTEGLLMMGVLFHLFIAVVMRLNTFFWSFIATYPAIIYCANLLSGS